MYSGMHFGLIIFANDQWVRQKTFMLLVCETTACRRIFVIISTFRQILATNAGEIIIDKQYVMLTLIYTQSRNDSVPTNELSLL